VRDLWHAGTGASDNASSVATMEAMRILKILKLPMRRTVQIALWGGEECGILGSRKYVEKHVNSEHAKVSICINRDSGAGRLRGVFLMENKKLAPIFVRWMIKIRIAFLGLLQIPHNFPQLQPINILK
jgi:carboxypeptidase Q